VEWSKDKTQAAESKKWRPQQAYGSNQFLLDVFDVLISLVIVEESVFVRAMETQLSAILWSRGAILL